MKAELIRILNYLQNTPEDSSVEELNNVINRAIEDLENLIYEISIYSR
jgi:hypothetical protein